MRAIPGGKAGTGPGRATSVAGRRLVRLDLPQQLLLSAALAYAVSFALLLGYWHQGRGIGSSLYLAIVLAAMATGPSVGAAAGALAAVLYWGALISGHDQSLSLVLSLAGAIHLANFVAVGVIVGYFARASRRMLGTSLHLLEDLLDLARRDVVTGTANAAGFEAATAEQLRQRQPFVLLVGTPPQPPGRSRHSEDDLRRIASALGQQLEHGDRLARIGDAEFALLVPCTHAREAPGIAARLERALEDAGLRMTFGWAAPSDGKSALELYAVAAARLYNRRAARNEWKPTPVSAALVDELDSFREVSVG